MTDNLTTLIGRAQGLLMDDGTRFTTVTLTAAMRSALRDMSLRAPLGAVVTMAAVSGRREYSLSDEDGQALQVVDVLLQDVDGDDHESLPFDVYQMAGAVLFRLREPRAAGETLLVRYTAPHTLSGLDGATSTTVAAFYAQVLVDGACYYACYTRAVGRIEQVNLNKDVADPLMTAAEHFRQAFELGLVDMARAGAPVTEPTVAGWNDEYHGWNQ